MKWLADENFPFPSFRYLVDQRLDVIHASYDFPSVKDERLVAIAREQDRILLTFDSDFGKLIFTKKVEPPPGVIFFRILDYTPENAGRLLIDLLADNIDPLGFFIVVRDVGIKRRRL